MTTIITKIYYKGEKIFYYGAIVLSIFAVTLFGCENRKTIDVKGNPSCEILYKAPATIAKPIDVNYGNKVKLLGATVEKLSQNSVKIIYYWQLLSDLGSYDRVFVHFSDSDNKILFQGDHDFCQKQSFATLKGKIIKETHLISVPQSEMGKEVYVKVGIFSPTSKPWDLLKIETTMGTETVHNNTSTVIGTLHF
jgi:hypothetical protein